MNGEYYHGILQEQKWVLDKNSSFDSFSKIVPGHFLKLHLHALCHSIGIISHKPNSIETMRMLFQYVMVVLLQKVNMKNYWRDYLPCNTDPYFHFHDDLANPRSKVKKVDTISLSNLHQRRNIFIIFSQFDIFLYLVLSSYFNCSCQNPVKSSPSTKLLFNNIWRCLNNIFPIFFKFSCHDCSNNISRLKMLCHKT